jgi:hypothetical protein
MKTGLHISDTQEDGKLRAVSASLIRSSIATNNQRSKQSLPKDFN